MAYSEPDRESGEWLPGVDLCPTRAIPCGNPLDADEAMRARDILRANPNDPIAITQAKQAMKNALKIASQCEVPPGECPIESHLERNRTKALLKIATP